MEKTWPSRSCASTFTSLSLSPKPISSNTDQNHLHLSPKPKKITSSNHSRSKSRFSSTSASSSSSSSIRDFSALPFDVLTMIAANFSHPSLQTASLVCRAWRDALKPLREAMLFLRWGKRFKHGRGVKQNTEKALESFLKGAARGSTLAMVDAGLVYWEMGKKEEAIQLYRRAAELADSAGQCNLGISYLRAESPNPKEAVKWLKQASVSGHIRAQYQLALCLHQGHGVEQNLQEAARWYLKAAEGGYVRAMYNTSLCYSMGEGLVLNHRLARKWMKRAADRGHCKAQFEHGLGLFSTFRMGLWSIWISGILLIAFSFYATQKLPSSIKDQIKNTQLIFPHDRSDFGTPKITIFTAPSRPFSGSVGARQVQAIRSWIGLSPNITVVLFTKDPSVVSFAGEFGSRVSVEPDIDFTFLGTPFFHSMVARSLASLSDISVIIDPETILLPDFILTLSYAHKLDHDWLLVSSSRHVSYFPFHLDEDGKHWLGEDGKQIRTKKLQGFLSQAWQWKHCEERMLLAWNNGDVPLHNGVLPPFLFGKELHNHWVVNEALSSDYRFVFDASWSISNFYLNPLEHGSSPSFEGSNVTNSGNRSWESVGNLHLGSVYGALSFREANYSNMVKFCMCNGQYLFVNPAETTVYPFGHRDSLSLRKEKILGSRSGKKVVDCVNGFKSLDVTRDCYVKDQLKPSISLSLPLTLETLLSGLSDKNKTIVLAVAGYSYKDMLMNWVCRLKHLLVSNFVVCALDRETYEFAVLQGLPVFKDSLAPTNISFNDCHFGTQCFQRVTKVKSRLVLQILKLGYNVLMSDVDVYWFKNPLPFLYSFGPSVLVAQSDEYNVTGPINVPRRLNSGFYFARNDGSTVAALEKVVKHAATSNLSEQPSFYDTLCGEGGSNRVGHDQCFEPETNLTVHFLDRDLFPNGAYKGLWEKNPKASCEKECFVLHNNWISGRRKKLERQVSSGLWEYDINSRMCVQNWQKAKFSSYF